MSMERYNGKAIADAPLGYYWHCVGKPDIAEWEVVERVNYPERIDHAGTNAYDLITDIADHEVFIGPLEPPPTLDQAVAEMKPAERAAEIGQLQRQLLDMLKTAYRSAVAAESRAAVTGTPVNVLPGFSAPRSCLAIRQRLLELDPAACLYAAWGGAMP